jgi:4-hydroxy-2-oxoglutarate aldolase
MDDEALVRYYTAVADSVPIPVMIYNIPKFASNVLISPDVISRVASHPNIAGMKDSSAEDVKRYLQAVPEESDFHVLCGSVNKFYQAMLSGCVGGVLSMANYFPDMTCRLHRCALAGPSEACAALDEEVRTLSANAAGRYGPAGVKAAMDILGLYGGPPRNPLRECSADERSAIRAALQEAGFLAARSDD